MDFDPRNDQLVFLGWKFTSQKSSIRDRVDSHLALIFGMDVRCVVLICIIKKHPDKNTVKHGYCWHDKSPDCYAQRLIRSPASGASAPRVRWSELCTPSMGMNLWGESPLFENSTLIMLTIITTSRGQRQCREVWLYGPCLRILDNW